MGKKEILQEVNYDLPKWATIVAWILFGLYTILNPYSILFNLIALAGFFYSAKKSYSLARRMDKNGTFPIWLCMFTNFIGLLIYWIY